MTFRNHLGMLLFALGAGYTGVVAAQDGATLDVLGKIEASWNGEEREWLTLGGTIDGQATNSASWHRIVMAMPSMGEAFANLAQSLPPEERAKVEAMGKRLQAQNRGGQNANVRSTIELTINGHNPNSPSILTEQVLSLNVPLHTGKATLGTPMEAQISYVHEAAENGPVPKIIYGSGNDGTEPTVTFEALELEGDEGYAKGTFSATLCRFNMQRLFDGPDLSDCVDVAGSFDTALVQDDPVEL